MAGQTEPGALSAATLERWPDGRASDGDAAAGAWEAAHGSTAASQGLIGTAVHFPPAGGADLAAPSAGPTSPPRRTSAPQPSKTSSSWSLDSLQWLVIKGPQLPLEGKEGAGQAPAPAAAPQQAAEQVPAPASPFGKAAEQAPATDHPSVGQPAAAWKPAERLRTLQPVVSGIPMDAACAALGPSSDGAESSSSPLRHGGDAAQPEQQQLQQAQQQVPAARPLASPRLHISGSTRSTSSSWDGGAAHSGSQQQSPSRASSVRQLSSGSTPRVSDGLGIDWLRPTPGALAGGGRESVRRSSREVGGSVHRGLQQRAASERQLQARVQPWEGSGAQAPAKAQPQGGTPLPAQVRVDEPS
jgi:hypothetical protein